MSDDYGPYGKGLDGYVHYMQAVNEGEKRGGGGNKPPGRGGCLGTVIMTLAVKGAVITLIACLL